MAGAKDYQLRDLILSEELVLVTNNWRDLDVILGVSEIHPGLMIIKPNLPREKQKELFGALLAAAARLRDTINKVLEVDEAGNVKVYELPRLRSK
jgi:hypothetical protein